MLRSIVEYFSDHEAYKCGYCKRPDTNYSHGMWAHSLKVADYQDLINRGWRRSGKYCYKPTMDLTCCPMYTIRCRALEFKATKSQKKVLKRFNKYLVGQDLSEETGDSARKMSTSSNPTVDQLEEAREQFVESTREHQNIDISNINVCPLDHSGGEEDGPEAHNSTQMDTTAIAESKQNDVKKFVGLDPEKAPCKKAKLIRRERKLEKLKQKGIDVNTLNNQSKNREKQIEDFINELSDDAKQKLEIRLVRTSPPSPEWLATAKKPTTCMSNTKQLYTMTLLRNAASLNSGLFSKKPFIEYSETGPPSGYGSFHQQYWLDKKLIAVGVIDILPQCVSSVYFFYDPQYTNLTLGTYGALREIEFTRQLNSVVPELKYYYLGFYIHSCTKMRYKGNFFPSDLVCPETYQWFSLKDCIPKLDASPYCRLNPDLDEIDTNYPTDSDINYLPVFVNGNIMLYKVFKRKSRDDKDEVKQYATLVGAKTAKSMILVR